MAVLVIDRHSSEPHSPLHHGDRVHRTETLLGAGTAIKLAKGTTIHQWNKLHHGTPSV